MRISNSRHPRPLEPPPLRYRAVSRQAVASVVFGVLSILTVFSWWFAWLPVAGLWVGRRALRSIDELPHELTGRGLAWTGLGLSLGLGIFGAVCLATAELREVPRGYTAVSFDELQPDRSKPEEPIPPAVLDLEAKGTKIFLRGYMYPGRQSTGIKQFILVPTLSHCSFCSRTLKSTEMVEVRLAGDLAADFKATLTGVGGKLYVDKEQAVNPLGALPYRLEADYIR